MKKRFCLPVLFCLLTFIATCINVYAVPIDGGTQRDGTAPLITATLTDIFTYDGNVGDPMFFRFVPNATQNYAIETTGSIDTEGELYNSAGTSLVVQDGFGAGDNFLISYALTAGTTYYLRVTNYTADGDPTILRIVGDSGGALQGANTSPTFVGGTTTLTVNQNAGATDIKALLHVSDTDSSQTETWTQSVAPNHSGTLSISGATASSGSTDITPGGTITYQPANGYSGTETFTVQVSDGTSTATRQITVTVIPPPTISSGALAASNGYLDITFDKGIYGASDGTTALTAGKLALTFTQNGGSATNATISSVKKNDNAVEGSASALTGGETTVRVFLSLTGTPSGLETIEIKPANGASIYDIAGNAMSAAQTTGVKTLNDKSAPTLVSAARTDNTHITVTLSKNCTNIVKANDGGFSVSETGTPGITYAVSAIAQGTDASHVVLTVANMGISSKEGVTVKYTAAGNGTVQDTAGNSMATNGTGVSVAAWDTNSPTISSATLVASNSYLDITFGEGIYGASDGATALTAAKLALTFTQNGGSATNAMISSVKQNDNVEEGSASVLNGGETTVRVFLSVTGTPSGLETIEIKPANGTSVYDVAGNAMSAAQTTGVKTLNDKLLPTVTSVTVPANATYIAGQNLDFTVNWSENVTVNTTGGTPYLPMTLNIGGTVNASYNSGSGTSALVFRYTVQAGNVDLDGVAVGASITANGGTIKDAATNNATLTLNSVGATTFVLVDAVAPTVSSVSVPANNTYIAGQNLDFTVNWSENLTVNTGGGTPYIPITLNTGGTVNAAYVSGTGTSALVFRYTVQAGSADPDGISVGAAIIANGGTIKDAATNNATLTLNSVGATTSVLVDAVAPTISTVSVPANATYIAGQNLDFTVNWSENVTVNTGGGTPYIPVTLSTGGVVNAVYVSGTGTSALVFRYVVQAGKADPDGITVGAAITLNGGTIKDAATNNATLTLNSVGATTSVLVDAVAPTISTVSVPANATYIAGQNLDFTVNWSENVTVNTGGGTPYIPVTLSTGGVVNAVYVSGTGTSALVFRYIVQAGNADPDGISVGAAIILNGGTIKDAATNNATLTLNSVGATTSVLVDAVAPTVSSVSVPANNTYIAGQNLDFTVNWSKNVIVNNGGGTPYIPVTLNTGGTVNASYVSGTGTTSLVFRYTVQAGTSDPDGITVGAAITLNGGTIKDAATNNATLTLNSVGSTAAVLVDAEAPTVTTPTTNNLGANQVTLAVTATGSGTITGYFTLLNGSGTGCGTAAQVKAGQDSSGLTAPYHGSLPLTSGAAGSYTLRKLTQSTAYTACVIADNGASSTIATTNLTTSVAATYAIPGWVAVGSAGFSTADASSTSLALAPDGTPYLGYQDLGNSDKATVMKYDGTNWVAVGNAGFSAGYAVTPSLAFAPDGTPYLGCLDGGNSDKATVMKYDGTNWVTVGSAGFSAGLAGYPSLAFAPDGTPFLGYYDGGNSNKATVMKYDGTNWVAVGLAGFSAGAVQYPSLAFAPDGTPYLGYRDNDNFSKATVMKYDGTSWVVAGSAGFSAGTVLFTSLAVASDGTPYLGYMDGGNGNKATVMKYNGTNWVAVGSAGFSAGIAAFPSLALAPDGTPYLGYRDNGNSNKATVMKYDGTSWVVVGSAGFSANIATSTSLAFAPDGTPYLGYRDGGNSDKATVMKLTSLSTVATLSALPLSSGSLSPAFASGTTAYTASVTNATSSITVTPTVTDSTATVKVNGTAVTSGNASDSINLNVGSNTITLLVTAQDGTTTSSYTVTVTRDRAMQTITFTQPANQNFGTTPTLSATASSGLIPTFTSGTTGVCTITSGGALTFVTTGTCTINADQAGNGSYTAAPQVSRTFTVNMANQTLSFGSAPSVTVGETGAVSATGGASTSPVTFSSTTTAVCTVSGTTVTGVTAGTCTIAANQAGDANYNAAAQVTQNITIGKGAAEITITPDSLSATYDGSPKAVAATTSPPGLTVTHTYDGSATPPTDIGSYTVVATVSDSNYEGTTSGTLIISYGSTGPSITLSTLADAAVTSVPTLNIRGIVTADNGLKSLAVSGTPVTVNNNDGFSTAVTLKHGSNTIDILAIDNADLETTVSRTITLDATAPLITPDRDQADNSVINTPQTTISGTVDSAGTTVTISVNGGEPQPAVMNGTGFSLPVDLVVGLNTIIITATDSSGKTASIKQSVTRNSSLALAVTTPGHDLKSGSPDLTISGTVTGTPPLTVTVDMDGQSFTQTVTDGSFSQALTFAAEKSYPITVTASDGDGNSASVTRTVIYAWLGNSDGGETATLVDTLRAFHIFLQHEQAADTDMLRYDVAPLDQDGKPQGDGIIDLGDVILLLRNSIGLLAW